MHAVLTARAQRQYGGASAIPAANYCMKATALAYDTADCTPNYVTPSENIVVEIVKVFCLVMGFLFL